MTIQRRILVGHLALTILLIVLVVGIVILRTAEKQNERSLQARLNTTYNCQALNEQFEKLVDLRELAIDLQDSDLWNEFQRSLVSARRIYLDIKPQLVPEGSDPLVYPNLEDLFLQPAGWDSRASATTDERRISTIRKLLNTETIAPPWEPHTPDDTPAVPRLSNRLDAWPSQWSSDWVKTARRQMRKISDFILDARERDTRAEKRTKRVRRVSVPLVMIAAPFALAFSLWSVFGVRQLLRRLIDATRQVAGGELNLELPEKGNDEIASLSKAFNEMSAQLAKARRVEADFLAVASHELKTPLALIQAHARMLRGALPPEASTAKVTSWLDRIEQEVDHLVGKSSELLTLGRIEAGQLQLDVREFMTKGFLIRTVGGLQAIAAQRKIDYEMTLDKSLPETFTADPDRLEQVLSNLLENAIKYTPVGGRVRFSARAADEVLEIEVSDTGPGIPAEHLPTIFDKYERVRAGAAGDPGGAGLGLAVARGIVLAHGGTIGVRSTLGSGSTFLVRLPFRKEPAKSKEVA